MHPHEAYKQQKNTVMPRIDVIIALYRKAIVRLECAEKLIAEQGLDAARLLLSETQVAISCLAAGLGGSTDEAGINYLRLYEFVSYKLTLGAVADIEAARKVLSIMLEGFVAVRDQAAALEAQGKIPPLERDYQVQVSA